MEDRNSTLPQTSNSELPAGKTEALNLDHGIAAVLCYLPILCGLNNIMAGVFLFTEPKSSKFVRFHAIQSLLILASAVVLSIVSSIVQILNIIPVIGQLIAGGVALITFFYIIGMAFYSYFLMYKANQNQMPKVPVIGFYADKFSD